MPVNVGFDDILLISPLIVLFLFSLVPITIKVLNNNEEANPFATRLFGMIGVVVSLLMTWMLHNGAPRTAFDNALVFDGLSFWVGFVLLVTGGISLFLLFEHVATKGAQLSEQIFLLLNSIVGMQIMIWSNDIIVTYIGIETMSLGLYLLIALNREGSLSKEASFKYFILGGFASAILLYGVSFIYGIAGTTYLDALTVSSRELMATNSLFLIGTILVVVGFCFKVAIFPFHSWTPDVYQGAATPVTSFMATAVKLASFVAFLRIILTGGVGASSGTIDVLQWLAVLTMIVGNVTAILQDNFKRMLAYSSVAHSGYAFVGIVTAAINPSSAAGSTGLIFYLFAYSLMTLGAFAVVAVFEKFEDSSLKIDDLKGLAKKHPILSLMLTIILLSLAGLPPTLGFFGKFYLFSAAIGEGLVWLAVWAMINSVISVYYYLRPVVTMYMVEGTAASLVSSRALTRITIAVSAVGIVILGLVSSPVFESVQASISTLF